MQRLFARYPEALARTLEIADRCRFSLTELAYQYPAEVTIPGLTPQQALARLTWEGAAWRYPEGVPDKVTRLLEHELRLIETLAYAPYFLTVHAIVRFARSQGILCQGRGSAANSAVCYVLGITSIDPERNDLLFERFVSAGAARAARHRRRLRARAARDRHAVGVRHLRPRSRRALLDRDPLPRQGCAARCRQGAGPARGPDQGCSPRRSGAGARKACSPGTRPS